MTWAEVHADGIAAAEAREKGGPWTMNASQYVLSDTPMELYNPVDHRLIRAHAHPSQAFSSYGDSGGPLFFNTPSGLALAGTTTGVLGECLLTRAGDAKVMAMHHWEPVVDNLAWIMEVQERASTPAARPPGARDRTEGEEEVKEESKLVSTRSLL